MSYRNSKSAKKSGLAATNLSKKDAKIISDVTSSELKSIPVVKPPVIATPVIAAAVPPTPALKEPTDLMESTAPKTAPKAPTPDTPQPATAKDEEAHFDVAQNVYGTAKGIWSWGKSVPIVSNLLGLSEVIAAKVLDATVHMDLPALDSEVASPQLKKIDDDIVTPAILAIIRFIEPALVKGDEMVIKPVMKEVVPRVLAPLGMFQEKKEGIEPKKAEQKKTIIDISPNPEVVPALN